MFDEDHFEEEGVDSPKNTIQSTKKPKLSKLKSKKPKVEVEEQLEKLKINKDEINKDSEEVEYQKLHYWESDQFTDVIVCPSLSFDQEEVKKILGKIFYILLTFSEKDVPSMKKDNYLI